MSLVERLEKLAKEFDRERWETHSDIGPPRFNVQAAEYSDLLQEAARTITRLSANEMPRG